MRGGVEVRFQPAPAGNHAGLIERQATEQQRLQSVRGCTTIGRIPFSTLRVVPGNAGLVTRAIIIDEEESPIIERWVISEVLTALDEYTRPGYSGGGS